MTQLAQRSLGFLIVAGLLLSAVPALAQTDATTAVEATSVSAVSATGEKVEVEIKAEDTSGKRLSPREEKTRMELERKVRAEGVREEMKVRAEVDERGEIKARMEVRASDDADDTREVRVREEMRLKGEGDIALRDEIRRRVELKLEDVSERATTLADLRAKREERRAELEDEEASTTPKFRNAVKNANEVRLAVHTLLASKDLTGGIGPQISEIAKRMNDAVGTTTNAEAQIESRGFLKKLFFGGDETAANAIKARVESSKVDIAELTTLLADPAVSPEVAEDLKAQIEVLEKAQERLEKLADKEGKRWGFFSWRFAR